MGENNLVIFYFRTIYHIYKTFFFFGFCSVGSSVDLKFK